MGSYALLFNRLLACLTASTLLGCVGAGGAMRGDRYDSPEGNFSFVLGDNFSDPPVITDAYDEGVGWGQVQVDYDSGSIEVLSFVRLPRQAEEEFESMDKAEYQDAMLSDLDVLIQTSYGNAEVRTTPTFIPSEHREMLFAVLRIPEGSNVCVPTEDERRDGIRGILIFCKGGYGYHIHKETVDKYTWPSPISDEEVKRATLDFYERIKFTVPVLPHR